MAHALGELIPKKVFSDSTLWLIIALGVYFGIDVGKICLNFIEHYWDCFFWDSTQRLRIGDEAGSSSSMGFLFKQ